MTLRHPSAESCVVPRRSLVFSVGLIHAARVSAFIKEDMNAPVYSCFL